MLRKGRFLGNRHSLLAALFIVLEQSIAASSTIWIVQIGQSIGDIQQLTLYFVIFVLSLTVVYIPTSISNYFLDLSIFKGFEDYIKKFSINHYGKAALYRNTDLRKTTEPFLINESWMVINEVNYFLSTYFRTAINILFNVMALSFVISSDLTIAYALSIAIVVISLVVTAKKIESVAKRAQDNRLNMISVLSAAWENVLIGNRKYHKLWQQKFDASHSASRGSAVKSTLWVELSTNLSSILGIVPIIYVLFTTITTNAGDVALLTALIATLPRQIMTVHYISDLAQFSNQYTALKAQVKGLINSSALPTNKATKIATDNIAWGKLTIRDATTGKHLTSENQDKQSVIRAFNASEHGRLTVSGPNGSGKSSLLLYLKDMHGEDAFYLPANSELCFKSTTDNVLSTGEKHIAAINELAEEGDFKYLLLDEWDANLDAENTSMISAVLDQLSASCCVIEVRHKLY